MYVYLFILGLIVFLSLFLYKKNNGINIFLVISFIILTIITGFRNSSVGVDTEMYVRFFHLIKSIPIIHFNNLRYEYGFSLICKLLSYITSNYHIFLLIISSFINFSVLHFIKKNSKNVYLSVMLYILCNFMFSSMNIMRQSIAIGIILLGYEKLKDNKTFSFVIYVLIASQIHLSSIVCLFFILFKKVNFNKKYIVLSLLISFIMFMFGNQVLIYTASFSERLALYLNSDYSKPNYFGSLLEFLVIFIQFIFGLFVTKKYKEYDLKDKNSNINTLIGILSMGLMISIISMRATIFNRFLPYCSIFLIVWLPTISNMIKNHKNRMFINFCVFSLFLIYFCVIGTFRPEWYAVIPYRFMD